MRIKSKNTKKKKVLDLTQERDNALIVKVGLEDSSKKLGNMLSNQRNENNKIGLEYFSKNA